MQLLIDGNQNKISVLSISLKKCVPVVLLVMLILIMFPGSVFADPEVIAEQTEDTELQTEEIAGETEDDDDYDDDAEPVYSDTALSAMSIEDLEQQGDGSYIDTLYSKGYYFLRLSSRIRPRTKTKIVVSSANPAVVSPKEGFREKEFAGYTYNASEREVSWDIELNLNDYGKADVVIQAGASVCRVHLYICPEEVGQLTVSKESFDTALLTWTPMGVCDGYYVYRFVRDGADRDALQPVMTLPADASSAEIKCDPYTKQEFFVIPFMKTNEGKIFFDDLKIRSAPDYPVRDGDVSIRLMDDANNKPGSYLSSAITSVKNAGNSQLVTWHEVADAAAWQVVRSESDNGAYKPVTDWMTKEYQAQIAGKGGHTYYYRIQVRYPDGNILQSEEVSLYLPPAKAAAKKSVPVKTKQTLKKGQYSEWGNWSCADETYYYQKGGKLHVVVVRGAKLYDYTLSGKLKIKKKKTVNIGKHDTWGAFYYGEDGNYYVATGFLNDEENPDKIVVKVVKYNSAWKKCGTCNIKGNASNLFVGIWDQFKAGNGRMAMKGDTLVLFMARGMFAGEDGARHQSNIGFAIHTQDMTYNMADMSYVSHSFNQFVRFKGDTIYQLDHGDAYPRALRLTITKQYDPYRSYEPDDSDRFDYFNMETKVDPETFDLFRAIGKTGDNYTGIYAGGMEIGKEHVLVTALSTPQEEKIAGVTGNKKTYKRNVLLITCKKDGSDIRLQWLTKYNPKKSKTTVGESRIIKISDELFAIMYSVYSEKDPKGVLHYVLVDDTGKVLAKKKYRNMIFTGGTQPVFFNGQIFWSDVEENDGKSTIYHYSIPVGM
ncbi:MAG: hypothetical protein K6E75_05430 [Lachnospiraceae bacterium]|nr:hypothetical protein [Lachnospiraceae bacterium]